MRICCQIARLVPLAAIAVPISNRLYDLYRRELYCYDDKGKPIYVKKISCSKQAAITPWSEDDAKRLADTNLKRLFKEAIEANKKLK